MAAIIIGNEQWMGARSNQNATHYEFISTQGKQRKPELEERNDKGREGHEPSC